MKKSGLTTLFVFLIIQFSASAQQITFYQLNSGSQILPTGGVVYSIGDLITGTSQHESFSLLYTPLIIVDTPGQELLNISTGDHELITVYPNPVHTKLLIESPDRAVFRVKIYQLSGELIYTFPETNEIDFESFAVGAYLVQLLSIDDEFLEQFKVIKN
ncbi:T9SS type A sorting domain-containing protein [Marinoscillum sp. MHG1-6]|uniref:T9SS type A sorting domain-containing protein n=1 Tax=Marinoscillum sp. MHG1-6 TaxID=2959627 RepID=UPI00215864B8|nr:T9SS type A sorting domain-containing protein [Marinoscillum sp. MHG1-6]